ncbi:MAG: hypothetical protein ACD_17C00116G0002 [uncultured bacterium]|nr:MAG: hypothetical protein ACD_17C00116G0002 [uncultured bacterium]
MTQILEDEIRHVSFGYRWLNRWKGESSTWDYWLSNLSSKLGPERAKGQVLIEENRKKAGIPLDWIEKLKHTKNRPKNQKIDRT